MYLIYIILVFLISTSMPYNVQVNGKVEVGKQVSDWFYDIFKELFIKFFNATQSNTTDEPLITINFPLPFKPSVKLVTKYENKFKKSTKRYHITKDRFHDYKGMDEIDKQVESVEQGEKMILDEKVKNKIKDRLHIYDEHNGNEILHKVYNNINV